MGNSVFEIGGFAIIITITLIKRESYFFYTIAYIQIFKRRIKRVFYLGLGFRASGSGFRAKGQRTKKESVFNDLGLMAQWPIKKNWI